jgi:hypothetical protein
MKPGPQSDGSGEQRTGIILLPFDEGWWSASSFKYYRSARRPQEVRANYTEGARHYSLGDGLRFNDPDAFTGVTTSFYKPDGHEVFLEHRTGNGERPFLIQGIDLSKVLKTVDETVSSTP